MNHLPKLVIGHKEYQLDWDSSQLTITQGSRNVTINAARLACLLNYRPLVHIIEQAMTA